jgi:hypothetical protein
LDELTPLHEGLCRSTGGDSLPPLSEQSSSRSTIGQEAGNI